MPGSDRSDAADVAGFPAEISRHMWNGKYRADDREQTITATWRRVAHALVVAETRNAAQWEARFFDILKDFKFLPGGRIIAGAGTKRRVTLFNCFVMGAIEDSIPGIFRALEEGAVTMQQGGGIGCDFSTLRPRGTRAKSRRQYRLRAGFVHAGLGRDVRDHSFDRHAAGRDDGNVAVRSSGYRGIHRGQAASGHLTHFNLSVQVTDGFMAAVRSDAEWPLIFPAEACEGEADIALHEWPGFAALAPVPYCPAYPCPPALGTHASRQP